MAAYGNHYQNASGIQTHQQQPSNLSTLNLSARSHFQPYIATSEEAEAASQTITSQVLTAAVNEAVGDINEAYSAGLSPGGLGIAGGGGPGGRTPAGATGGRGTIEMPNIQALGLSSGGWQSGNHPMAGLICDFCQEVFRREDLKKVHIERMHFAIKK